MKKSLLLFVSLFMLFSSSIAQEESEGIKSLKRKCKEVRKQLEEKYGEDLIINDCEVSMMYGFALESVYSFKSSPECKSKIIAHFTDKYKEIKSIEESLIYDRFAYLRKEKALSLLTPYLSKFKSYKLNYTPFELSINLEGEMNNQNNENIKNILSVFENENNQQIISDKVHKDSNATLIPRFYLYLNCDSINSEVYPLLEIEKNTLPENILKIEKKLNIKALTNSEYNIYTESSEIIKGNGMRFIQRKVSAYDPNNVEYKISVGGFNYINQ